MANVTWSTTDKSAGIALTGGNLIARNSNNATCTVRASNGQITGKFYWEYTCNAFTIFASGVGVAGGAAGLATSMQTVIPGCGVDQGGAIYVNTVNISAPLGAIAAGNVICVALDCDARLVWYRKGAAGNWNNSASANPATGVGGVSILGLGVITFYPWVSLCITNDQVTANFGDTAFSGAVPSGFTSGFTAGTNPPLRGAVTQAGVEHWGPGAPAAQITQTALEVWGGITAGPRVALVTQAAVEEWGVIPTAAPTARQYGVTVNSS